MSKPAMRLVDATSPPRTPERESLAEAIARHAEATNRLAAVQAARERTEQARRDAKEAIAKATAGVEQAKIDAAAQLVGSAPGALSVKAARAALTDCEDALEAAIEAGGILVTTEKEAADEVEWAQTALKKCVGAVVKSEANVGQLLKEAEAAQAELINKRIVLRHLFNNDLVAEQEQPAVRTFMLFQNTLPVGRGQLEHGNFDKHPAADPYKRAIEALRTDADAPLPTS